MTQYVMIQNRGEIPLRGVRLLGLSTKDESQIGQFGTGLKEAIALLMRRGLGLTIYSGTTPIEFDAQDIDGEREIMFRVGSDDWKHMNLHVNFGRRDWTDIWQALREIVCNAIDEGIDGMHREVTDAMVGVAGSTRVYIEADFDCLDEYSRLDDKLLMLGERTPVYKDAERGSLYSKNGIPAAQIFHRGVWVQASPHDSLYDYELSGIALNESRSSSWFDCHYESSYLLSKAPTSILANFLTATRRDEFASMYEGCCIDPAYMVNGAATNSGAWRAAWAIAFGENAVACYPSQHIYDALTAKGIHAIPFESNWFKLFRNAGIPTHDDQLNEAEKSNVQIIASKSSQMFDGVWDALDAAGFVGSAVKPSVFVFRETDTESGKRRNGFCAGGSVYINEDILGSREERVTCLEEAAHHITEKPDSHIDFQNWLMDKLDRAMFENKIGAKS